MKLPKFLEKAICNLFSIKFILSAVPTIITNSKGEILLGKRSESCIHYPLIWGLPGGLIDFRETFIEAALREIKEETGIEKEDLEFIKQGKAFNRIPSKRAPTQSIDIPMHFRLKTKKIPLAKDETLEVKWFKPQEIKNMKLAYAHKEILKQEGLI